jgi:zinc transport system ATP-binding protein
MPGGDPPLLEASDVTLQRDGRKILDSVSLAVARRSIHLLIGPNGAGKSSLLAALLGQTVFSGTIRYHWRGSGRIGYVPQSFAVDRTLPVTVTELLALPRQRWPVCLGVRRATRARVQELLERVGLGAIGERRLGALSGGEMRRVLLANTLHPEPEIILLDEPGSGMDQQSVARMEETLLSLRESAGTTILMVSHDMAQVRRLADRVTLLDSSVRRTGSAEEVLSDAAASSLGAAASSLGAAASSLGAPEARQ